MFPTRKLKIPVATQKTLKIDLNISISFRVKIISNFPSFRN
jgi:hypothetical protein